MDSYVLFELAGTAYGIRSASVSHIEMVENITLVPHAHPAIDGVVFSRGEVIPALNLRVRFGFERETRSIQSRIIFARVQDRVVGLVVDSAREFQRLAPDAIRPIEGSLTGINRNYLTGLATVNQRLILILDLEAALDLDTDRPLAESLLNLAET